MNRGDIILVNIPNPTDEPGHEQSGHRPALIVHDNSTSNSLPLIMIIPFTTKMNALNFPHTLVVQPSSQNGLTSESVLMVFQLRALDINRIIRKMGEIEANYLEQTNSEIIKMLGL